MVSADHDNRLKAEIEYKILSLVPFWAVGAVKDNVGAIATELLADLRAKGFQIIDTLAQPKKHAPTR